MWQSPSEWIKKNLIVVKRHKCRWCSCCARHSVLIAFRCMVFVVSICVYEHRHSIWLPLHSQCLCGLWFRVTNAAWFLVNIFFGMHAECGDIHRQMFRTYWNSMFGEFLSGLSTVKFNATPIFMQRNTLSIQLDKFCYCFVFGCIGNRFDRYENTSRSFLGQEFQIINEKSSDNWEWMYFIFLFIQNYWFFKIAIILGLKLHHIIFRKWLHQNQMHETKWAQMKISAHAVQVRWSIDATKQKQ